MKNIVVAGATGTIGRRVVQGLAARQAPVVAVSRDPANAASLESLGARVAVADFANPDSLTAAFAGASTLVLITPPNAVADEQAANAVAAARNAGVEKIVRISALKAGPDGPTDNTRQHGRTEALIRDSGLKHVILRPHLFMQNLLASLGSIAGQSAIYFGSANGRMGMVDTRDVSDAAVAVATSSDWDGETYELTGPESIDYNAVATAVSRGLGREVRYVAVPPGAAGQAMRELGADDWVARIITEYCQAYASGWGDFTTDNVQRITGHEPRSIDDFVKEVLVPAAQTRST